MKALKDDTARMYPSLHRAKPAGLDSMTLEHAVAQHKVLEDIRVRKKRTPTGHFDYQRVSALQMSTIPVSNMPQQPLPAADLQHATRASVFSVPVARSPSL